MEIIFVLAAIAAAFVVFVFVMNRRLGSPALDWAVTAFGMEVVTQFVCFLAWDVLGTGIFVLAEFVYHILLLRLFYKAALNSRPSPPAGK